MKIAIVGCGALGSYYGAQLCRAGQEVHFLLRTDFDVVRRQGVEVRSAAGDFHVHPRCARAPAEIGPCDLILIGLKTTANAQLASLLPPLVGPRTAILTLQNGLGNEAHLAALFGAQNILGGLCFVCLNRLAPGVIQHVAHGKIVLGEWAGQPQLRTHALANHFRDARVPCEVTDNLARTHWEKLVWNIPFNGLGVAGSVGYAAVRTGNLSANEFPGPCLTTDRLLSDPPWEQLVRELMAEVIHTARALGLTIPDTVADEQIARTRTMGAYRASTLIDFARRQPLELDSLFLEPLRQALVAGVSTPRLSALCQVLTVLNPK